MITTHAGYLAEVAMIAADLDRQWAEQLATFTKAELKASITVLTNQMGESKYGDPYWRRELSDLQSQRARYADELAARSTHKAQAAA